MNSNIFKLKARDWAGATVSAVLVAVIGYVLKIGDVFILDWHTIVNIAVMAGLASLIKNLLTTEDGNFVGLIQIK